MADLSIIRAISKNKGMTLKNLAEKLHISEPGLQRILRTNSTKIETLEKIAEILDMQVTEFFSQTAMIPNNDIVYTNFIKDLNSAILCKRYRKFSEKLSYYMDVFFLFVFPPDDHYMKSDDISMYLRYPFKHTTKPKFIFKRKNKSVYPKIPNKVREMPFSQWPEEYKQIVEGNNFLLESFYFPVFYFNLLNIVDYLNEGIIDDKQLVYFWNEWQKIEKEAKIVSLPLFIDVYSGKAVYAEED